MASQSSDKGKEAAPIAGTSAGTSMATQSKDPASQASASQASSSKVPIPDYIPKMFDYPYDTESDYQTIEGRYGPRVAIYATVNKDLFKLQRKYREFFAGPLAPYVQCLGTMGPLLAFGCKTEPVRYCTLAPTKYFADIFAADISAIKVRNIPADPQSEVICGPIKYVFKAIHFDRVEIPQTGAKAFVSREEFLQKLNKTLTYDDGTPDEDLRRIFHAAGDGITSQLETLKHNYCISGGFVSKMIDPNTIPSDITSADMDIFVYGDQQEATIDSIVAQLFHPGNTFITVRGSVVTIYRHGAMKVQIVSSAYESPSAIIADFDTANVMTYWSNGTVYANASCVRAFVTRTCAFKRSAGKCDLTRLIKLVRSGFNLRLNMSKTRRARITSITTDMDKVWKAVLSYTAFIKLDKSMPLHEKLARIMYHDDVTDVITNVTTNVPTGVVTSVPTGVPMGAPTGPTSSSASHPAAHISDDPVCISRCMSLKKKLGSYVTMNLTDVDWGKIEVQRFPFTPNGIDSLYITGRRVRFAIDTIGKINMTSANTDIRVIYILPEAQGKIMQDMVQQINQKMHERDYAPVTIDLTENEGIVKIGVQHVGHIQSHSTTIFIRIRVKCISAGHYELVMESTS